MSKVKIAGKVNTKIVFRAQLRQKWIDSRESKTKMLNGPLCTYLQVHFISENASFLIICNLWLSGMAACRSYQLVVQLLVHVVFAQRPSTSSRAMSQRANIVHCEAKKLHPCSFCNNLLNLRSSMLIFCKQLPECICNKTVYKISPLLQSISYSMKFNKRVKTCQQTEVKL